MSIKSPEGIDIQSDGSTTIVCLCGSASQKADFEAAEYLEELAGKIVLTLNIYSKSDSIKLSDQQVQLITKLHYQKMDMAHEILVILKSDPTGTADRETRIGSHARNERDYAAANGKVVNYFDPASQRIWA